jgi:hypothetical protein
MALAHIDATPAQERAIVAEVDKLKERLYVAKATIKDGRGDLAAAVRGPTLDDATLGAMLGRVDGATAEARTAGISYICCDLPSPDQRGPFAARERKPARARHKHHFRLPVSEQLTPRRRRKTIMQRSL